MPGPGRTAAERPEHLPQGPVRDDGTTAAVYDLGLTAETWLKRFSWVGLVLALLGGLGIVWWIRRRARRMVRDAEGSAVPAPGPAVPVGPAPESAAP